MKNTRKHSRSGEDESRINSKHRRIEDEEVEVIRIKDEEEEEEYNHAHGYHSEDYEEKEREEEGEEGGGEEEEEEEEEIDNEPEDEASKEKNRKGVMDGFLFVFVDLIDGVRELKSKVKSLGGNVSSVLSKKVNFLVATATEVKAHTYKIQTAEKYGIPVISPQYIVDCCDNEAFLDHVPYSLGILNSDNLNGLELQEELEENEAIGTTTSSTVNYSLENNTADVDSSFFYSVETTDNNRTNNTTIPTTTINGNNKYNDSNYRPAHSGMVKIYDINDPKAPFFPSKFSVLKSDILHFADLTENINKYYGMELQVGPHEWGSYYRIYTTYGNTDDLLDHSEGAPKRKADCRYVNNLNQAHILYDLIYTDKITHKGYESISLTSNNVSSTRESKKDEEELDAISEREEDKEPLAPEVRELVHYLYNEASIALKERISGKITEHGIETPLGILSSNQIQQGEKMLVEISKLLSKDPLPQSEISKLSGKFYSLIPHKIGQHTSALNTPFLIEEKQELLQVMKDLVSISEQVSGKTNDVTKMQYRALRCEITTLPSNCAEFESIAQQTLTGSEGTIKEVVAVYKIRREIEHSKFSNNIFNLQLLFHGSHIGNWLGILSRGILLPKRVTSLGVNRTDAGQLGYGIYFGNRSLTSSRYSSEGKKGTHLMAMCTVALGNVFETKKSKWHFSTAPRNYHSCHGITGVNSDFKEPHYAVYSQNQVRLEYLIEYTKTPLVEDNKEEEDSVEDDEDSLTRKNDTGMITKINDLRKTSTKWRIIVRVTYKTELLAWSTHNSRGNFFTVDFIDAEGSRIHAIAFRTFAVKFFKLMEDDKVYEVRGGSIRDRHENFTSIENNLEMILDKNTRILPVEQVYSHDIPRLEIKFLPIHEILALDDKTVVVTSVTEVHEVISKHGNSIPRRIIVLTCPPNICNPEGPSTLEFTSRSEFPFLDLVLWYKDASDLIIKEGDSVAVTKAQVNEHKGVKNLNTKHCSHHIYINPSIVQFEQISKLNKWSADWFNACQREPAPVIISPPSPKHVQSISSLPSLSSSSNLLPLSTTSNKSLSFLTPQQVGEWLSAHQLGEYSQIFEENKISGEILSQLSSIDLQTELGVKPFGHRFIIMNAFQKVDSLGSSSPSRGAKSATVSLASFEAASDKREFIEKLEPENIEEFTSEMALKLLNKQSDKRLPFLEHLQSQGCPDEMLEKLLKYLPYEKYLELKQTATQMNSSLKPIFKASSLNEAIRNEELYQRRLYTSISSNSVSINPDAHTITSKTPRGQITSFKVFEHMSRFIRREMDATEKDTSLPIFATPPDYSNPVGEHSVVENVEVFRKNFAEYTRAQFSNFNWSNMVIAGGTVFTCLQRGSTQRNMFEGPSKKGDIDVFLIGLDAAAAERKIHAIYNHIRSANPNPFIVVRTSFAISFISQYPNRTIQVILRLYNTIEEVLCYFDLDCVAVAYNGAHVYALPRAIRAFNTRTNFVDLLRFKSQSTTNDMRVIKYLRRGFGSYLVKDDKFESGGISAKVVAKVIDLQYKEELTNPQKRRAKMAQLELEREAANAINDEEQEIEEFNDTGKITNKPKSAKTSEVSGEDEIDTKKDGEKYDDMGFIPFGKEWDAKKILEHLTKKLKENEEAHKAKGSLEEFVPFYIVGTFEEIMGLTSKAEFTKKWGSFPHKLQWGQGWS